MPIRTVVNGVLARDDGVVVGLMNADGSTAPIGGATGTTALASSRSLVSGDDGLMLECTAAGIAITVPTGLPAGFAVSIIPNGATTVVSSGGTLLNGATSTLARNSSNNATISIISRVSAANSYVVTGA